jgi:cold shock CspA family protein
MEEVMTKKNKAWHDGTVHWFDSKSGEGMIKSADGSLYFVHRSAIESLADAKAMKQQALKDKQKVQFQLIEDVTFAQVSRVKELE